MSVTTFGDLDDAIVCFNAETTAGTYTISVDANSNESVIVNLLSVVSIDSITITGGDTSGSTGGRIDNVGSALTVSNSTSGTVGS